MVKVNTRHLTIILPANNEEESIREAVVAVRKENPQAEIIVVNDGSSDGTEKILDNIKKDLRLQIVSHKKRKGYGAALKTGFKHAKGEIVGFQDVDLTYNPNMFSKLIEKMQDKNLVCAWSDRLHGNINGMPPHRKLGNRIMVLLFDTVAGTDIKDCTSGQRVITREALEALSPETLPDGWGFITAFSKRLVKQQMRFDTIPSDYFKRVGSSKLNMFVGFVQIMYHVIKDQ